MLCTKCDLEGRLQQRLVIIEPRETKSRKALQITLVLIAFF
jgi:hypothetical protein